MNVLEFPETRNVQGLAVPAVEPRVVNESTAPTDLVFRSWWWDEAVSFARDLSAGTSLRHRVMWVSGYGWVVVLADPGRRTLLGLRLAVTR